MKFFSFAVFVAVTILFVTIRAAPSPQDSESASEDQLVGGVNGQPKQNNGLLGSILGQGNKNGRSLLNGGSLLGAQSSNSGNTLLQKLGKQYDRDVNAAYDFWIGRFNDRKDIWHSGATGTNFNNGNQQRTN